MSDALTPTRAPGSSAEVLPTGRTRRGPGPGTVVKAVVLAVLAVVLLVLPLYVDEFWLRTGFACCAAIIGAITFSAVAHLLRTALGTVGSSLLLVGLILQLAAAGGTYPAAVLPTFFAALHPFLPMTYLVDAFRVAISGGLAAHVVRDVAVLAGVAAAALGLLVATVARRKAFSMKDLHPPLVAP